MQNIKFYRESKIIIESGRNRQYNKKSSIDSIFTAGKYGHSFHVQERKSMEYRKETLYGCFDF